MTILSFWSFLQICILVTCVEPPDLHILDISKPSLESITLSDVLVNGVKTIGYKARDGYNISSIVHNNEEVWKVSGGDRFKSANFSTREGHDPVVRLLLESGGHEYYEYYGRNGGAWTELQESVYNARLGELKEPPESPQNNAPYEEVIQEEDLQEENEATQKELMDVEVIQEEEDVPKGSEEPPRTPLRDEAVQDDQPNAQSTEQDDQPAEQDSVPGQNDQPAETESTDSMDTTTLDVEEDETTDHSLQAGPILPDVLVPKGVLDISEPNTNLVTFGKVSNHTGTSCSYKRRNDDVTSIVEGLTTIWEAGPGDVFSSCFRRERDGHSTLLSIMVNPDQRATYFEKNASGKWKVIESREYLEKLYIMEGGDPNKAVKTSTSDSEDSTDYTAEPPSGEVSIDFSQTPDPTKIEMSDYKVNGVDEKKYEAKGNVVISSVKDGTNAKREIWKAGRGEVGLVVTLIMRVKFPILLVIRFKRNKEDTFLKITYDGSEWKTINDHTFYTTLKGMRKDVERSSDEKAKEITAALQNMLEGSNDAPSEHPFQDNADDREENTHKALHIVRTEM